MSEKDEQQTDQQSSITSEKAFPGSLTNHFLIAMPALEDPNFVQSVTYIFAHNDEGAMGITINRLTDVNMGEVFSQLGIDWEGDDVADIPVYMGGPVETERGFILHSPADEWDSTLKVTDDIAVTSSRDIIEAIAEGRGPEKTLVALGYAGWGAGQLEEEMVNNAWLSTQADPALIFDAPVTERWQNAASMIGVDLNLLSNDVGHA
jgi:putative transcriptional regulator